MNTIAVFLAGAITGAGLILWWGWRALHADATGRLTIRTRLAHVPPATAVFTIDRAHRPPLYCIGGGRSRPRSQ